MKFGMHCNYGSKTWQIDLNAAVRRFSSLGFEVVEVFLPNIMNKTDEELKEIKHTADDCGIELVYSTGLEKEYDISSKNEAVRKKGIQYLINALKRIAFIEGKLFGGVNYAGWGCLLPPGEFDRRPYVENSMNSLKEITKAAEDMGILYCMEVVNRYESIILNTAADAVDMIGAVGSPSLKVHIETYHANIEEKSIAGAITTAGDMLGYINAGETNRNLPGRGSIEFKKVFQALKDISYNNIITIQSFVASNCETAAAVGLYRNLVENTEDSLLDEYARESLFYLKNCAKQYCRN